VTIAERFERRLARERAYNRERWSRSRVAGQCFACHVALEERHDQWPDGRWKSRCWRCRIKVSVRDEVRAQFAEKPVKQGSARGNIAVSPDACNAERHLTTTPTFEGGPAMTATSDLTATSLVLHEGDVFRFSYSAETREAAKRGIGHGDLDWCFDGQLVVWDGTLRDTYWSFGRSTDGRRLTLKEAQSQGTLTFVVNLDDVREVPESETRYYADADCFNLSHQHGCYKKYAVRKTAKKNAERMLAEIDERMRHVRREADSVARQALHDVELLTEARTRLAAGDISVRLPW